MTDESWRQMRPGLPAPEVFSGAALTLPWTVVEDPGTGMWRVEVAGRETLLPVALTYAPAAAEHIVNIHNGALPPDGGGLG